MLQLCSLKLLKNLKSCVIKFIRLFGILRSILKIEFFEVYI